MTSALSELSDYLAATSGGHRRAHLSAVPECEPPYDDERPWIGSARPGIGQPGPALPRTDQTRTVERRPGTGAPNQRTADPDDRIQPMAWRSRMRGRVVPDALAGSQVADLSVPGWSYDSDVGVHPTATAALPDARATAGVLARAMIEAMAGLRQLSQLSTHCSPEVFAGLRGRVNTAGAPPKLMSVRTSEPADGVAEASVVFRRGQRAAAMAFRLQGIDGRWRVTALQLG